MNSISSKQLSIMIFFIPLVFKMATLPAAMFSVAGRSYYIAIAIITTLEFLQLGLVLLVINKGGMTRLKEKYGLTAYRLITTPLLFVIGVKCILFVFEMYNYTKDYLFYNITSMPIIIVVLIAVFYIGYKGVKVIGRMFELSIWFIPIIFLIGLIFGNSHFQPFYVTPVFAEGFSPIMKSISTYLIYTFDFSPLLFTNISEKKFLKSKVIFSSAFCVGILTLCYIILLATYGNATFLVNDAFASLASFNMVISEIGSLDWPSALLWMTTAILNIALKITAVSEILSSYKINRPLGAGIFCTLVGILLLTVFANEQKIKTFVTGGIQYFVFGIEIMIPIILLLLFSAKKSEELCYET